MRLYVVQHAEAVSKAEDPERPLSEKGRLDAERLAAFLARAGIGVKRVWHSGKLRARQTAELLQWAVLPRGEVEERPGLGPEDPVGPLADEAAGWEDDILLVGHLPFVDRLVARLVTGDEAASVCAFVPGTAVCLDRNGEGTWRVVWMLPPEVLAKEER